MDGCSNYIITCSKDSNSYSITSEILMLEGLPLVIITCDVGFSRASTVVGTIFFSLEVVKYFKHTVQKIT